MEALTRPTLVRIFETANCADAFSVMETPGFLIYQYGTKCPIYLSKTDGRIYTLQDGTYPQEAQEHQAAIVITILHHRGLVENYHEKRIPGRLSSKH